MGCSQSFKSCFCVSMGTNQAEGYDGYAHPTEEGLYLELKDEVLSSYAEGISVPQDDQEIQYVKENEETVPIPETLPENIASMKYGKNTAADVSAADGATLSVLPAPALPCRISFTGIMKMQVSGGESGLPAR